jgi:hypothetical protein
MRRRIRLEHVACDGVMAVTWERTVHARTCGLRAGVVGPRNFGSKDTRRKKVLS